MKYKAFKTSNCVSCLSSLPGLKRVVSGHVKVETLGDNTQPVIAILACFCVECAANGALNKDDGRGYFGEWNEKMGIEIYQ